MLKLHRSKVEVAVSNFKVLFWKKKKKTGKIIVFRYKKGRRKILNRLAASLPRM